MMCGINFHVLPNVIKACSKRSFSWAFQRPVFKELGGCDMVLLDSKQLGTTLFVTTQLDMAQLDIKQLDMKQLDMTHLDTPKLNSDLNIPGMPYTK